MKARHTFRVVFALMLVAGLSGFALAGKGKLDSYDLKVVEIPAGAPVVVRLFTTENADLGTAENPDKEKAREIADTMVSVAPPTFSEALVNRLTESGVFPQVSRLEEGEPPEGALVIEGEFTLLNPGSRGKRYWVGFGAGKSKICVKGRVADASGAELGTFEHCRSGTMGWFGGRAEGMMSTDVYQTAFRVADFVADWARGEIAR